MHERLFVFAHPYSFKNRITARSGPQFLCLKRTNTPQEVRLSGLARLSSVKGMSWLVHQGPGNDYLLLFS
jgi:hypothetical protein